MVLSLIPCFTPAPDVPAHQRADAARWQIALSIVLLGAHASLGVLWVAARIYRVGILMYGKRPTFPEIVKWVRHA